MWLRHVAIHLKTSWSLITTPHLGRQRNLAFLCFVRSFVSIADVWLLLQLYVRVLEWHCTMSAGCEAPRYNLGVRCFKQTKYTVCQLHKPGKHRKVVLHRHVIHTMFSFFSKVDWQLFWLHILINCKISIPQQHSLWSRSLTLWSCWTTC